MIGKILTVSGAIPPETISVGAVYCHEHLIIDSPRIANEFPHIHLSSVADAIAEVRWCRDAGVQLMVDAMPVCAGRNVLRLASVSERTDVGIVAATGVHHDRYYGAGHWINHVSASELADLFVADLTEGIDAFDYTGPIVRRTGHRAGVIKVATSGPALDDRDRRMLEAAALAHRETGAPILTHCEGGAGGLEQVSELGRHGVAPPRIILSHVDKCESLPYLRDLAATGAMLGIDQTLRQAAKCADSIAVRAVVDLFAAGFANQVVVGTDGARRSLWQSLGGGPGLSWLAQEFPRWLRAAGLTESDIDRVMRRNALAALTWS